MGGCESGDIDVSRASRCGITAWRVLSGSPHYKQVTSYEDDITAVSLLILGSENINDTASMTCILSQRNLGISGL